MRRLLALALIAAACSSATANTTTTTTSTSAAPSVASTTTSTSTLPAIATSVTSSTTSTTLPEGPPTYLTWVSGFLPEAFGEIVGSVPGIEDVTVVSAGITDLVRTRSRVYGIRAGASQNDVIAR